MTKVHVFPYSPRPGTRSAAADDVPVGSSASAAPDCARSPTISCRRRWRAWVGTTDRVLVDRPGRGYADDYTPWLVAGEVGSSCARVRSASASRGCSRLPPDGPDCLFCRPSSKQDDHVHAADGFVAIRDIVPKAPTHLLVLPERHVDSFRDVDAFPDEEAARMVALRRGRRPVAQTSRTTA